MNHVWTESKTDQEVRHKLEIRAKAAAHYVW
jgi:hypothetical protein